MEADIGRYKRVIGDTLRSRTDARQAGDVVSALFLNLTRPTLDSLDKEMRKNADGSVDIYIGSNTCRAGSEQLHR